MIATLFGLTYGGAVPAIIIRGSEFFGISSSSTIFGTFRADAHTLFTLNPDMRFAWGGNGRGHSKDRFTPNEITSLSRTNEYQSQKDNYHTYYFWWIARLFKQRHT